MSKAFLIRTQSGFKPAFDTDYEALKKIPYGDPIEVTWKRPRSYGNHKRFFAMLGCTVDNLAEDIHPRYSNIEYLRKEALIATGHCTMHETLGGKIMFEAKSISFSSLSEDDFQKLYGLVANYLLKHFARYDSQADFDKHIKLYM